MNTSKKSILPEWIFIEKLYSSKKKYVFIMSNFARIDQHLWKVEAGTRIAQREKLNFDSLDQLHGEPWSSNGPSELS